MEVGLHWLNLWFDHVVVPPHGRECSSSFMVASDSDVSFYADGALVDPRCVRRYQIPDNSGGSRKFSSMESKSRR